MAEELKHRKTAKSNTTKEINSLRRFIAEEDKEEVEKGVEKLKQKFKEFEEKHNAYHATLSVDNEMDESDNYFFEVQDKYIEAITSAKSWLQKQTLPVKDEHFDAASSVSLNEGISHKELASLMNLPHLELQIFNGDPLEYYNFISVFDEHVGNSNLDGKSK